MERLVLTVDELAEAMESRCYNGAEGRTKFKTPRLSVIDFICAFFSVLSLTAIILTNYFL